MPTTPMIINPLMIHVVLGSAIVVSSVGVGDAIVLSAVGAEGVIGVSSVGDGGAFDGGTASVVAFVIDVVVVESAACVLAVASSWDNSIMALAKNM